MKAAGLRATLDARSDTLKYRIAEGARMNVARKNPGVNLNILTDDEHLDPVSGTVVLNGVRACRTTNAGSCTKTSVPLAIEKKSRCSTILIRSS